MDKFCEFENIHLPTNDRGINKLTKLVVNCPTNEALAEILVHYLALHDNEDQFSEQV